MSNLLKLKKKRFKTQKKTTDLTVINLLKLKRKSQSQNVCKTTELTVMNLQKMKIKRYSKRKLNEPAMNQLKKR